MKAWTKGQGTKGKGNRVYEVAYEAEEEPPAEDDQQEEIGTLVTEPWVLTVGETLRRKMRNPIWGGTSAYPREVAMRSQRWKDAWSWSSGEEETKRTLDMTVVLDSGTMIHVVPVDIARAWGLRVRQSDQLVRGAGGHIVPHYWKAKAVIQINGKNMSVTFHVAEVRLALLGVKQLTSKGHQVLFDADGAELRLRGGSAVTFGADRGLYRARAKILSMETSEDNEKNNDDEVMPVEADEEGLEEPSEEEVLRAAKRHTEEAKVMPVMPFRMRPKTPGCNACSVRGHQKKEKHSVECKKRTEQWLKAQEENRPKMARPTIEEEPCDEMETEVDKKEDKKIRDSSKDSEEPEVKRRLVRKTPGQGQKRGPDQGIVELEEAEREAEKLGDIDPTDEEKMIHELEAEPWDKEDEGTMQFVEDIGQWWPKEEIDRADHKELDGLWNKSVFEARAWDEVREGAQVIDAKILRTEKAGGLKSRLVVRDIKRWSPQGGEYYAATPSQMAVETQLVIAARGIYDAQRKGGEPYVIQYGDVSQALVHAELDKYLIITFPKELDGMILRDDKGKTMKIKHGEPYQCLRALYGLRQSPTLWQEHLARILEQKARMKRLKVEPSMYVSEDYSTTLVVHVDDCSIAGPETKVKEIFDMISKEVIMKDVGILKEPGDVIKFLGREIRRTEKGLEVRNMSKVLQSLEKDLDLNHKSFKTVETPMVKYARAQEEKAVPLDEKDKKRYASILGKELYLARKWPEVQFACTVAARARTQPTTLDMWRVKHLGKYMLNHSPVWKYEVNENEDKNCLIGVVDSDWAGRKEDRRSTSGGMILWQGCMITSWARVQRSLALSSAEAEYYSLTTGLQECLHVQNMLKEMNREVTIELWSDSLGAKQAAERPGALHMRHMALRWHFLKEAVKKNLAWIKKIPTGENPADLLTKILSRDRTKQCLQKIPGFEVELEHEDEEEIHVLTVDEKITMSEEDDSVINIILTLMVTIVGLIWTHMKACCCKTREDTTETKIEITQRQKKTRTVMTQSQATYERKIGQPRFKLLQRHEQGSWSD